MLNLMTLTRARMEQIMDESDQLAMTPDFSDCTIVPVDPETLKHQLYQQMDLYNVEMERSTWIHLDATGSRLGRVMAGSSYLEYSNLSQVDLQHARFRCSTFEGCNLTGSRGTLIDFIGATFCQWTVLDGAQWQHARMAQVTFREVLAQGTIFDYADLPGCNAEYLIAPGASLRSVNLSGTRLNSCNLEYTDLTNANLSGATITKSSMIGATITGANLRGLHLDNEGEALLRGSDCGVVRAALFSLYNQAEAEDGNRARVEACLQALADDTSPVPDLFSLLSCVRPEETEANWTDPVMHTRLIVARFVDGMLPLDEYDDTFSPAPIRHIVCDWTRTWLTQREETENRLREN